MLITSGGACGKRKPPLPPVERVPQRVEISGFQRGGQIEIAWRMAARNASDESLINISRADIYRLTEPAGSSPNLSEEEFASRSTLIATLPIEASDFGGRRLTYTDQLNFAGQAARVRYAVRFVNANGQKAGFSNFLVFEPTARVAEPPAAPAAAVTQTAVELRWQPPARNIDGSQPANVLGYNVYRSEAAGAQKALNNAPVTGASFADRTFEFEKKYEYFVRTVSLGGNGEPLESLDSARVEVTPKDVFPPAAPAAVTIAAAPNAISIFFATNVETDVAGYRVYRSIDPNAPKADWTLLTAAPLATNTFQDAAVESGRRYYYYLTAVDKFGNVSAPSEVVAETVP